MLRQSRAPQAVDRFTPSDRTAAASSSYAEQMPIAAAVRRDAAAPGVGASEKAKTSTADAVIASERQP